VGALDRESPGDLALADRRRAFPDVGEDLVLGREGAACAHSAAFAALRPPPLAVLPFFDFAVFALVDDFALAAGFLPALPFAPFFSAWARSSSTALSRAISSSDRPLGRVALIPPCLT